MTALCILSMGLGIGLTTALFSMADAVFLRPFAFDRPGEVFWLSSRGDDGNSIGYGWPDYQDMQRSASNLADLAAYQRNGGIIEIGGEKHSVLVYPASSNFFQFLGVQARLGRASLDRIAGEPAAVIGHRLWDQRFGSDPHVAGQHMVLSGRLFVIAGVMPEEFSGLMRGVPNDVFVNMEDWFSLPERARERYARDGQGNFEILARLRPGVTPQRAAARFDAAIRGVGKYKPAPGGKTGTYLEARFAPDWRDTVIGGGLLLVFGLVLFVACANVAQVRLAQAEGRKRELGIRMALGAGSLRLTGELLLESSLISFAGAGLGLLLAQFVMQQASAYLTAIVSYLDYGVRLDSRVLIFALTATVCAAVFSSVAPARRGVKVTVMDALKSEQGMTGSRNTGQKKALVIGQIAVSVMLFGLAMLFLQSFRNAASVRPGFEPERRMLVIGAARGLKISALAWGEEACQRLGALPGVRGATFSRRLPFSGSGGGLTVRVEMPGQAPRGVALNNVAGNWFAVMGTRILAGRAIDNNDRENGALVAVVSQLFAHQFFLDRDPVGQWITIEGKKRQIIGVAENGFNEDIRERPAPYLYLPFTQMPVGDLVLMVETASDPGRLANAARDVLKRFDPAAVVGMTTLREHMHQALAIDELMLTISVGLGAFGFLLTAAGLFGVIEYAVNRRIREIGLRMALGAPSDRIWKMVIADSLRMATIGVPIGFMLLFAAVWPVRAFVLGVTAFAPTIYVAGGLAAIVITISAAWLPATRATRIDPMAALRSE